MSDREREREGGKGREKERERERERERKRGTERGAEGECASIIGCGCNGAGEAPAGAVEAAVLEAPSGGRCAGLDGEHLHR